MSGLSHRDGECCALIIDLGDKIMAINAISVTAQSDGRSGNWIAE